MFENQFVSVIIPAAGIGQRFSTEQHKPYCCLLGKPLLLYALEIFNQVAAVDEIILMVHESCIEDARRLIESACIDKITTLEVGGSTRTDTVRKALSCLHDSSAITMIHDAARPLVTESIIMRVLRAAFVEGAAICSVRPKNTIKTSDQFGYVDKTLKRDMLYEVQTPQAFKTNLIKTCYTSVCLGSNAVFTDDAALIEHCGYKVKIVEGDYRNIKITTPEDISVMELFMTDNKGV